MARDLKAHVAVWGRFRRESNGWAVDAKLLRIGSEAEAERIQASAAGWVDLAESVSLRVAKRLRRRLADDDLEYWRMNMPHNEKAAKWAWQGRVPGDFRRARRQTGSGLARSACRRIRVAARHTLRLLGILLDENRQADGQQAIEEFRQQMPGNCLLAPGSGADH